MQKQNLPFGTGNLFPSKAIRDMVQNFTGVNDIYEEPQHAEIVIDTDKTSVEEGSQEIVKFIKKEYIK